MSARLLNGIFHSGIYTWLCARFAQPHQLGDVGIGSHFSGQACRVVSRASSGLATGVKLRVDCGADEGIVEVAGLRLLNRSSCSLLENEAH